jgi:hypothetical protein
MKLKIVTQFEGWCRECGGAIPVGEQVYWKKGEGVRHIGCVPNPDVDRVRTRTSQQTYDTYDH